MTQSVIIIGAGGHAKVLLDTVLQLEKFSVLGLADKNPSNLLKLNYPVFSDDEVKQKFSAETVALINAVGFIPGHQVRKMIYEQWKSLGYDFSVIQHPQAYVSRYAVLREGVQVLTGAVIHPDVVIAENTIINTRAIIEHDVLIGAHSHVAPGAVILGGVSIGEQTFVGAGATILPHCRIGSHCVIGAGAVVLQDIPDFTTVAGVPAKAIIHV